MIEIIWCLRHRTNINIWSDYKLDTIEIYDIKNRQKKQM